MRRLITFLPPMTLSRVHANIDSGHIVSTIWVAVSSGTKESKQQTYHHICDVDQLTDKAINEVEFPITLSHQRRGWSRARSCSASIAWISLGRGLSPARVLSEFERERRRVELYPRRDRPGCDGNRILGTGRGCMMRYKIVSWKV